MKTNIKRVVNILLSMAMIVSLFVALGGMALAAPELKYAQATLQGDKVAIKFEVANADVGTQASLRIINKDTGKYYYLNQIELKAGVMQVSFPVNAEEIAKDKATLRVIVVAATGTGTADITISNGFVDKTELTAAIKSAKANLAQCTVGKDAVETAIENAEKVEADSTATAKQVEDALDALKKAIAAATYNATGIPFASGAIHNVKRGEVLGPFTITPDFGGNETGNTPVVTWTIGNTALLQHDAGSPTTDTLTATFKALNKTGSCTITAKDSVSGKSYSVVVKVS